MTYQGRNRYHELKGCPKCGRYAGRRKTNAMEDMFFVVCEVCGYKTKGHTTQHAATAEWNRHGQ